MARTVIIFNPVAGAGKGERVARELALALERRSDVRSRGEVRCIATRAEGGARPIAGEVSLEAELIVVVGGDGTLRETIEGLGAEASRVSLGLVPLGNANVAARELAIPLDCGEAIGVVGTGEAVEVDMGLLRADGISKIFTAVVGVGWDARTVERLDRLRRTKIGGRWYRAWADSAYLFCGLRAMLEPTSRFRVHADGARLDEDFCGAHFCNFATYAKGMSVVPNAHFQSGRLHYQARKRSGSLALAWHFGAAALRRKVPRWLSLYGSAETLRVEAATPLPVQIDGDFLGHLSAFEVTALPAAVKIRVPRAIVQSHDSRRPRA